MSYWFVFEQIKPIPMLIFPVIYGITVGVFSLNGVRRQLLKAIQFGVIFLFIFIISTFFMLSISKKLLGSDDFLPFLSTLFSIISIVLVLNFIREIKKKSLVIIVLSVLGILATFIGNWFSKCGYDSIWTVFVTIPFLWQIMTGIPLLIWLNKR